MKCLTIYQPYASLIAIGAKRFETRGQRTNYRGPLNIHAGLKKPSDVLCGVDVDVIFAMGRAFGIEQENIGVIMEYLDALPRGAFVARSELTGCWRTGFDSMRNTATLEKHNGSFDLGLGRPETLFGDFSAGRFAWGLEDVKQFRAPIPARGKQGLWNCEVSK